MTKEQQEKQSSAAAAESISSPRPSIPIGARVELRGLKAKPELNGRRGVVVKFIGSSERCRVQLDEGGGEFSLDIGSLSIIDVEHCSP